MGMAAPREPAGRRHEHNTLNLNPLSAAHDLVAMSRLSRCRGRPTVLRRMPRRSSLAASLTRTAAIQGGRRRRRR